MPEGKTIKQIADELGISKQAVQKRIAREPLCTKMQPYIATVAGVKYIAYTGEMLIKSTFIPDEPAPASIPTSIDTGIDKNEAVYTLISMLKAELDGKNQQISELNARLADTTAALLAAQKNLDTAQTLHIGTIRKQLTERSASRWHPGILTRLFGKERKDEQ